MDTINDRLAGLRVSMKNKGISAYIIPSSDAHQSEYVAYRFKSREWISGFTGSAGTVVVTPDHAGVWTDSRYFLQGEEELSTSSFELHKVINQGSPQFIDWIKKNLPAGSKVACDGSLFSKGQIETYEKLMKVKGLTLDINHDLIEGIWQNRPALPQEKIYEHDVIYAGKSRKDKLTDFRVSFVKDGADAALLTGLDDIAWLYNLRGSDVESNPVFIAYSVVTKSEAILFLDTSKINTALTDKLAEDGIKLQGYDEVIPYLNAMSADMSIHYTASDCNMAVFRAINAKPISGVNHIRNAKAIKNQVEIGHIRNVMEKDGVALTRMYMWLEKELETRGVKETEIRAQLSHFRSQLPLYVGESFGAIIGFKSNGAIIHYNPKEETAATVNGQGMLLVDSGGQFLDGTTDTTRTIYLGTPSAEEKQSYTQVLQGYIALDQARYPAGTRGSQLDILARQFLWKSGKSYGHGTGHGVGFFMNVHEPPQGFTAGPSSRGNTVLQEGMLTSNEPGFYKPGAYGIRIENLLLTILDQETEFGRFLKHETMTLYPLEAKLIDTSMLSTAEIDWVNTYHTDVLTRLTPHLEVHEVAWLRAKCVKIS